MPSHGATALRHQSVSRPSPGSISATSVITPTTRIAIPTSERVTSGLIEKPRGGLIGRVVRRRVVPGPAGRPPRARGAPPGRHAQTSTTTGKTIGRRFVCSYR